MDEISTPSSESELDEKLKELSDYLLILLVESKNLNKSS